MLGVYYKSKKALKENVGKPLLYVETSFFSPEYKETGINTVVGPDPYNKRNYFATVETKDNIIIKVK